MRWINQIHRDDAARAVVQLVQHVRHPGIYNVTDSTPATHLQVYSWLADHFHRPLPSYGPARPAAKAWLDKQTCEQSKGCAKQIGSRTFPAYRDAIATLLEK